MSAKLSRKEYIALSFLKELGGENVDYQDFFDHLPEHLGNPHPNSYTHVKASNVISSLRRKGYIKHRFEIVIENQLYEAKETANTTPKGRQTLANAHQRYAEIGLNGREYAALRSIPEAVNKARETAALKLGFSPEAARESLCWFYD